MADKMPAELLKKFEEQRQKKEASGDDASRGKGDSRKRALAKARKAKQMAANK